jgi:hypothetical protein
MSCSDNLEQINEKKNPESFPNTNNYFMKVKLQHLKYCLERIQKTAIILIEDHESANPASPS